MIKKYILVVLAVLLVILLLTPTTTASLISSKSKIYEILQENSAFSRLFGRISQLVFYKDDNNDEPMDPDGPKDDVNPPKIVDVDGEVTPDDGNETVVSKDVFEDSPNIDTNGKQGATLNNESKVIENEVANETTVDKESEKGKTLERVIEIITEYNGKLGTMLQRVVERTFAPGTTESDKVAENIVDTVVVVGESDGSTENNISNTVILTDGDR